MTEARPYEITHVAPRLRRDFTGLLKEAESGTEVERERNFLTRALAAFAIHQLSGASREEAVAAVVDGGGDGGIDAIHYSAASATLWAVQSKYIDSGRGEPELGDVSKFKNGIENLLQGRFEAFETNTAWKLRLPQVQGYFNTPELRVRAVLVYSGINLVSEDRLRLFEDVRRRFCRVNEEYFQFASYNLTTFDDWITGADATVGVGQVEIEILNPGVVDRPYYTVFGQVRLKDVAALQAQHGQRLVAANIRRYKGATEVNARILATLRDEPEHFFYLNNGLTAYCERMTVSHFDRADAARKRVTAYGFSIVNGAQTLGSVQASCDAHPETAPDGYAFLKIISLERCDDDVRFARRITRSTNFQNQVGSRDFVALDDQQHRIARQLELDDIVYHFKDGEGTPWQDGENFTLDEATVALACIEQEKDCDLCTRVLADRKSLWSTEEIYPEGGLYRTRYDRLFRADLSARMVWRAWA